MITVTVAINGRHFFTERKGAILTPLLQPVVMKKILVPTDFSQAAQNAGEYALSLAQVTGASVHLLHVDTEVMPVLPGPEPWIANANSLLANKDERIRQEVVRLRGKYPVALHSVIATGPKETPLMTRPGKSVPTCRCSGSSTREMGITGAARR